MSLLPEFPMQEARVGGIRLRYTDVGSGEPLLLLHGAGPAASGVHHYCRNIEALARRFRVIVPDQPNFGRSDVMPFTEAPSLINARAADGLLAALGIERAHVAGYSMGGSAAIRLAATFPQRVRKLILIGGGGPSLPTLVSVSPTEGIRLIGAYARAPSREKFDTVYRLFVERQEELSDALIDELWAFEQDTVAKRAGPPPAPALIPDDLYSCLRQIKAETLVIRGRDDRYAPLDQGLATLNAVANSRLHVFSRCGHWVQFEVPAEFNGLVMHFLDGTG